MDVCVWLFFIYFRCLGVASDEVSCAGGGGVCTYGGTNTQRAAGKELNKTEEEEEGGGEEEKERIPTSSTIYLSILLEV